MHYFSSQSQSVVYVYQRQNLGRPLRRRAQPTTRFIGSKVSIFLKNCMDTVRFDASNNCFHSIPAHSVCREMTLCFDLALCIAMTLHFRFGDTCFEPLLRLTHTLYSDIINVPPNLDYLFYEPIL